ncbi:MAG: hypothetical protein GY787_24470, partial [Alteromonadales bacterium]|nr:hypothetical protein [Alteromonadales bacterium]
MKNIELEKIFEHLGSMFVALTIIGLITVFSIQVSLFPNLSIFAYISWSLLCAVLYAFANHFKAKNSSTFDFYKVAEPIGRQTRRKKQNIEERLAIHTGEDGLDPMVLFNEEKSGVACILKLAELKAKHKLAMYLSQLDITVKQEGQPIAGQTLMEMSFQDQLGYYRLSSDGKTESVEFAFPLQTELLYEQVSQAIDLLLESNPDLPVTKIDVTNFQAMRKFYNYVQRLSAPENRSVEYLSYCQGTLEICNSSYVELYDCTLQSTLTSWTNQDGLIRSDNVDAEPAKTSVLHLMNIELPYPECRLTNIQIVKVANPLIAVKL